MLGLIFAVATNLTICYDPAKPGFPITVGPCPTASPTPKPTPTPTLAPTATPSPTSTPTPVPTMTPTPVPTATPTAVPTNTPVPTPAATYIKTDIDANSIPAPSVPIPETTPAPLCIAGSEYAYVHGDDFTQETQAQFARYTTQWEINQYVRNGTVSNWKWSDQYSGIGRRNDFSAGDTYMVHIDDNNPGNSYPAPWVNFVYPRPGAQILTDANGQNYLDIRAVAVPPQYVSDSRLNGAHWLTGGIQEGPQRSFGYTEATVQMPANDGAWPSVWQLASGDGSNGWSGTLPFQYEEIDTFEKFGNAQGIDQVQMTANSGRPDAFAVRPKVPGMTTAYHTYGELWVPPLLGNPSFLVFYVDRVPVSYYIPTGPGAVNYMVNLQMGLPGSFVGTPDKTQVADLKLKNYFTWMNDGQACGAGETPIPTPTPTPTPIAPPAVSSAIVPQLQPYAVIPPQAGANPVATTPMDTLVNDYIVIAGFSGSASAPPGFATTNWGDAYLFIGKVGTNGVQPGHLYRLGGAGLDRMAVYVIRNATTYTVNPDIATGWHSEANPQIVKSQTIPSSGTSPVSSALLLAFGYGITDDPRTVTSMTFTANVPFAELYRSDTNVHGRTFVAMEATQDPNATDTFMGTYTWAGAPASNGNDLFPALFTVIFQ